ncbi:glycosyltransferase family 2 protein [Pseudalkalibacillus sp. Hm43]|uniref:glycosyltransferase family 2 protein n=1 Tax=Pseudalkalibacillus sp. Hm43 TaxID=3450742 RepID=UPI003F442BF4
MISVIIPLYNVENYILKCLHSFEKQCYSDFELIIVDDGSIDNSSTIVEKFQLDSSLKIKLLKQNNAGVSVARNVGLDNASGDYICFVDADDIVAPEYLSEMIKQIKLNHADLVICGFKSVPQDWGLDFYSFNKNTHTNNTLTSYEGLLKFLYFDIKISICSLMVKKTIIENNHLRFSEGYRYSEDMEMVWKIIANSKTLTYINSELYFYRIRNDSAMSLIDDKRLDGFKLIKNLESYFEKYRPDFSEEFKRFGAARWVWATMWQLAVASNNYYLFKIKRGKYKPFYYMKQLVFYPKKYVSLSALLYCITPYIYYKIASYKGEKRLNNRKITT